MEHFVLRISNLFILVIISTCFVWMSIMNYKLWNNFCKCMLKLNNPQFYQKAWPTSLLLLLIWAFLLQCIIVNKVEKCNSSLLMIACLTTTRTKTRTSTKECIVKNLYGNERRQELPSVALWTIIVYTNFGKYYNVFLAHSSVSNSNNIFTWNLMKLYIVLRKWLYDS